MGKILILAEIQEEKINIVNCLARKITKRRQKMARLTGVEPATYGSGVRRSIH